VEPFVRGSSAFDHLRKASVWLSRRFPWDRWDSVWFVLTNAAPFVSPIQPRIGRHSPARGEGYGRNTLTLVIDAWISATSVNRVFRAYQRALIAGRNREISAKILDLLQYVTERMEAQGQRVSWQRLWSDWNRAHQDRAYSDRRNFRKAFLRAKRALVLPEDAGTPTVRLW
jgi:hypothetical protein